MQIHLRGPEITVMFLEVLTPRKLKNLIEIFKNWDCTASITEFIVLIVNIILYSEQFSQQQSMNFHY